MYGLPLAGSLGHDFLEQCLNEAGYCKSPIVPGPWKHNTCPIQFTLIVDDFGVKYTSQNDVTHLIKTPKQYYDVSIKAPGKHASRSTLTGIMTKVKSTF
ncbi:hypothetical protein ACHAW6_000863 [Cyclotella cf. meneghiniana]